MKKTFIGILIGMVICGAGYMITHKDKPVTTTTTVEQKVQETTKEEEGIKPEKATTDIKVDTSKMFVTLNGKQQEVGLAEGLRTEKYENGALYSFRLYPGDLSLGDILSNPNSNYDPIWFTGDNGLAGVAFMYKGQPAMLRLENNKLRFAIGTKEVTNQAELDKVAMSLFGESAYWDYLNTAAPKQAQMKNDNRYDYNTNNDDSIAHMYDKELEENERKLNDLLEAQDRVLESDYED